MKFAFLFLIIGLNSVAQDTPVLSSNPHDTILTQGPLLARSTGPMPFLEYGPGDDRLGGAKMTYLDSNLLLTIVDSSATDYKVQLSKNHSAYIQKTNTKPDSVT